jgi:hypothetical protein
MMPKIKVACVKGECDAGDVLDFQDRDFSGRWYLVRVTDLDVLKALDYHFTDPIISAGGVVVWLIYGALLNVGAQDIRHGCHFKVC